MNRIFERWKRRLLYSRIFRNLIGWTKAMVIPGMAGFSVYEISHFFFKALNETSLSMRASAISFKVFAALFPAMITLLTLIPYIPVADLQTELLIIFYEMLPPEVYAFVETTLQDLVIRKHGTLLSVSFIVGVYLASNSINAILLGFSTSSNLATWHSPFKQRMLSLGLLMLISLLLVVAIPIMTISGAVIEAIQAEGFLTTGLEVFGLFIAKWAVSILLVLLSTASLYHVGDPSAKKFKLFTPGALLTVFLIIVLSQVLAFVFANFTDYNALYGSIGAILLVQVWIYLNMIVLLVGYELNISISRASRDRVLSLRRSIRS